MVGVRTAHEKQPDVLQIVGIRGGNRIVPAFDIPVVGRQIQRSHSTHVGKVDVGAPIDQEGAQFVPPVVRRGQ